MYFHEQKRRELESILGPELMRLLDLVIASSPYAPTRPRLSREQKHDLNAAAWRSDSQRRRAGYSNEKRRQRRRLEAIIDDPDFDPYR